MMINYLKIIRDEKISQKDLILFLRRKMVIYNLPSFNQGGYSFNHGGYSSHHIYDEVRTEWGAQALKNNNMCYTKAWLKASELTEFTKFSFLLGMVNIIYWELTSGKITDSEFKERINFGIKVCETICI